MAAVFVLCLHKNNTGELEILLGKKLNGRKGDRGFTVPGGHYRKRKDKSRKVSAARELNEETDILVPLERFREFRLTCGDYWFLVLLTSDEKSSCIPEQDRVGRSVWGPAIFYPIENLPSLPIARWQRKKLNEAINYARTVLAT